MQRRLLRAGLMAMLVLATSRPHAAQRTLTLSDVEEAIRMGQTRIEADRVRFHAPYRLLVSTPPVDYVDVVTPYRRIVIAAGEHAQAGDRSFGQRQALQLLTEADGRFDFVVELTFHPLNTMIGVPDYHVALVSGRSVLTPVSVDRRPRFGARVEGLPPAIPLPAGQIPGGVAQPILGGTLTARFNGEDLNLSGAADLVVTEQQKELVRVTVNFARLR